MKIPQETSKRPGEHCGVFGVFGSPEAANLTYLGLYALQHRGQESAGMSVSDRSNLITKTGMGRVTNVFKPHQMPGLKGDISIGHVRYSTTGSNKLENAQPISVRSMNETIAGAHNGNLVNAEEIRTYLETQGAIFHTSVDTEIIFHLMSRTHHTSIEDRLIDTLLQIHGAYSLVVMNENTLIAARDPHGFRPLSLGQRNGAYFISSETCALDIVGADYIRDILPGEVLKISDNGLEVFHPFPETTTSLCIFEFIYFSRPDSYIFNKSTHSIRQALGVQLALESPATADMVVPVPDSSNPAAIGYAKQSGIQLQTALIRSHYIGRTFIEPTQSIRNYEARLKYNPVAGLLKGKRIILVDDSIMRGTTSRQITELLRHAGVKEIHMRISAPPTAHPCFYGIDIPTHEELIASNNNLEEIRKFLNVDTLAYLSVGGLHKAAETGRSGYCDACFTGKYPLKHSKNIKKLVFEKYKESA